MMEHNDIFGKSTDKYGNFPETLTNNKSKTIKDDFIIPVDKHNKKKETDLITTNLIIDSRDRLHDDYADPSNYTIKLPDTITNVVDVELIGAEIPKTQYNINQYNNKLEFTVVGSQNPDKVVTVTPGNYTEAELVTTLNADQTFTASLVISYDARTRKFNISKKSGNAFTTILLFEGESEKYINKTRVLMKENSIGKVLGFNRTDITVPNGGVNSTNQVDMDNDKYVMLKIKEFATIHGIYMGVEDAYAKIVLDNDFGTVKIVKMQDIGRRFIKTFSPPLGKLNDLEIEFRTYDNNLYDFNGIDHCLFFKITTLKQSINYYN
jgi:hypothetical protein